MQVEFKFNIGDYIVDNGGAQPVPGRVTHQVADKRGKGYWIEYFDADGKPHERYVLEEGAQPGQRP